MLPMMAGMLTTSIISGQLISRTGRYRVFPIAGTAVMGSGLFLLSRLTTQSTTTDASLYMLLLGLGLGMVMQVLVLAVQNAADYRDLGVATSGATLFRSVGGSIGTAILGTIFATQLFSRLTSQIPAGVDIEVLQRGLTAESLQGLDPVLRSIYVASFVQSMDTVFLVATIVCAFGFVLAWFLPERPLRETIASAAGEVGQEAAEAFGRPADTGNAERQLVRAFRQLADRQVQRQHIQMIVSRAGVSLSPLAAWILIRLEDRDDDVLSRLREANIEEQRMNEAWEELRTKGVLEFDGPAVGFSIPANVSTSKHGRTVKDRLKSARLSHLSELAAEWEGGGDTDAGDYLRTSIDSIVHEVVEER